MKKFLLLFLFMGSAFAEDVVQFVDPGTAEMVILPGDIIRPDCYVGDARGPGVFGTVPIPTLICDVKIDNAAAMEVGSPDREKRVRFKATATNATGTFSDSATETHVLPTTRTKFRVFIGCNTVPQTMTLVLVAALDEKQWIGATGTGGRRGPGGRWAWVQLFSITDAITGTVPKSADSCPGVGDTG